MQLISELSGKLQSLSISEEDDTTAAVDSNGDADDDEREVHEEIIQLFPGGNRDAVRYVLDAIAPYCEEEDKLYENLRQGKYCKI